MARRPTWEADVEDELTVARCMVCATALLKGEVRFCSWRCEFDDETMRAANYEPDWFTPSLMETDQ